MSFHTTQLINNTVLNWQDLPPSVGANYRAAQRAKSDADFLNKLKIVEEEIDESIYFLQLLSEFNPVSTEKIAVLIEEATELLKVIVACINTTRRRIKPQTG